MQSFSFITGNYLLQKTAFTIIIFYLWILYFNWGKERYISVQYSKLFYFMHVHTVTFVMNLTQLHCVICVRFYFPVINSKIFLLQKYYKLPSWSLWCWKQIIRIYTISSNYIDFWKSLLLIHSSLSILHLTFLSLLKIVYYRYLSMFMWFFINFTSKEIFFFYVYYLSVFF